MYKKLEEIGIIPVVVIDDENDACDLAKALIDGGLPCAEVTFRTPAAKGAIKRITEKYPDMIVGAGTILTIEQAKAAVDAGAKFIVSPGINEAVVKYCVDNNIIIVPGCANPSNIETALSYGINYVKFFPAEQAGGIDMINALSGPYTSVRFMPTGGINEKNIDKYLTNKKIFACGGSYMVNKSLIAGKRFDEITKLTKKAVNAMLKLSIESIKDGNIVASVANINRFIYHASKQGVLFDFDNAKYVNNILSEINVLNSDGSVKFTVKNS